MIDAILALNAGSSSLKFALFEIGSDGKTLSVFRGLLEGIGTEPHFTARSGDGTVRTERRWPKYELHTHETLLGALLDWVDQHLAQDRLVAIGHRIVHGGAAFTEPVLLSNRIIQVIEALTPLAPLHQPHSLARVRAINALRPGLPQIACFDTAFHHTIPALATRFGLPFPYEAAGVRRYGFHGLSYDYIARRLRIEAPHLAAGRVIVAHLGNGSSLCAMQDGRSIDTTMGFTALDGLMMGTRCGAIDPGVLLYLMQQKGMSAEAVEDLLYRRSGLLRVSGLSSDMRTLLASDSEHAKEAIALYVFRATREVAALTGSLGGLDAIVFIGGIGEHAAEIRHATCERLRWLGVDPHEPDGRVAIRVTTTDEEAVIAQQTLDLLNGGKINLVPAHYFPSAERQPGRDHL